MARVTEKNRNVDAVASVDQAIAAVTRERVDVLYDGLAFDTVSYAGASANAQVDLASYYGWDGVSMDFYNSVENATGGVGTFGATAAPMFSKAA